MRCNLVLIAGVKCPKIKNSNYKVMEEGVIAVFIPIIAIIAIAYGVVQWRRYENDERRAMIEKGMDPGSAKRIRNTSWALRFGLLFIGAGLGLLCGYMLDSLFRMEEVAYFSMIFIFGGLGLGISYIIEEKKNDAL